MRAINLSTLARHLRLACGAGHDPGDRVFVRRAETVVTGSAEEIIMLLSSDVGGAGMVVDQPSPDEDGEPSPKR